MNNTEKVQKSVYNCTFNDGLLTVSKNNKSIFSGYIQSGGTDISCGVDQLYNIQILEQIINHKGMSDLPIEERKKLLQETIDNIIVDCKNVDKYDVNPRIMNEEDDSYDDDYEGENKCRFLMVSNNKSTPYTNAVFDLLTITSTPWKINPNSDQEIKVWIL